MRRPGFARITFLAGAFAAVLFVIICSPGKPRVLAVGEVPVAFWAWRTQAPSSAEVQKAFAATNAKTLFLRAGQFDVDKGSIKRIRPVSGTIPAAAELHLVYNGTRKLLGEWEQLESQRLAETVAETYRTDLDRAWNDNVHVKGIQLDLDIPTRLLPRYAAMLRKLRELLPPDAALSITGLPTWAGSDDIHAVLAAVDFWIPQCYGARIPTRVTEYIPISSPADVARTIARVRRLEKPFYAGLAAYGYAILYGKEGELLELRGDIDPSVAARSPGLELTDARPFKGGAGTSVRYQYRANSDHILDGLVIRSGETLVFDVPTEASLRADARAVRENAGELLLGICLFRLPAAGGGPNLSVDEITAALNDTRTRVATAIQLETAAGSEFKLHAENKGTAAGLPIDSPFTVDLTVPVGSIDGVLTLEGFSAAETLCRHPGSEDARPCTLHRANVIRLKAPAWKPGTRAVATLRSKNAMPASLPVLVTTRVNDGRVEKELMELHLQKKAE